MFFDLRDMSLHRLPAADLAHVLLGQAAAHIVSAVPLEPAARIVWVYPALSSPFRQRLARIDAEIIERAVAPRWCELGARKPACGILLPAIGQVFAAEHAEFEHLSGRQIGLEFWIETAADLRR